jgi:hypothetical protein
MSKLHMTRESQQLRFSKVTQDYQLLSRSLLKWMKIMLISDACNIFELCGERNRRGWGVFPRACPSYHQTIPGRSRQVTCLKGTHARDFIVLFSHFFGIIQ